MADELILHLGDFKTGSTALQSALHSGAYEVPGQPPLFYPGKGGNHNGMVQALNRPGAQERAEVLLRKTGRQIQESGAARAVISAEHFQNTDPQQLQQMLTQHWPWAGDRLRLIAYVRPHADKLLSVFSTQLRMGFDYPSVDALFEEQSAKDKLDYTPRFQRWRAVFGDRFELRPFIRSQLHGGDIITDFMQFAYGSGDVQLLGRAVANASLTVGQMALLRLLTGPLNQGRRPKELRKARSELSRIAGREIERAGLAADSGRLRMPEHLMAPFISRYSADAQALDAAFFSGTPMTDALQSAPERLGGPEQSLEASAYFAPESVACFKLLADILCALARDKPELMQEAAKALRQRTPR